MTDRCWLWAAVTAASVAVAGCVTPAPSRPAADPGNDEGRGTVRTEPGDPSQFIRVRPYRDRRGDAWLTLTNTAPVVVRDVSISAQYRDPRGRVWHYSTTISKIGAAGGIATVPTSFSGLPDDRALRNITVRVTRVQVE